MPRRRVNDNLFKELTWDDLNEWAGSRIVSRGKNYQRQGRVSDLATTDSGDLVAWVEGSERYAAKVDIDHGGLPESICTCPYEYDCKHGVAVILEYLERVEDNKRIPRARMDDERLQLLENADKDDGADDEGSFRSEAIEGDIHAFLEDKTKAQLIELILELAEHYPEMGQGLADRRQVISGNTKSVVTRLRREIREISEEPGWQDNWHGNGYTPDYSAIRNKFETLLAVGCADEVFILGEELMTVGTRQVEESHDEGETAMEIAACMPVIVKALDQSSLTPTDKLAWAVDVVLKDEFDLFEAFAEYLMRPHKKQDWSLLADQLLDRLKVSQSTASDTFDRNYDRDCLSNWIIHALEQSGRTDEIIPLCEIETQKTNSYLRLVERLTADQRIGDAERWIQKGIGATKEKWPGIAASLRKKLCEIRVVQENWPVVAAIHAEEFVRRPSRQIYTDCRKAARKIKAWPKVRGCLLAYLESGMPPWEQKGWPLPETGLDAPDETRRGQFPMVDDLIDIAIFEKKPDRVLHWYDQRPKQRHDLYALDEDRIATAIQNHAPDRAIAMWKKLAENLIAQVKPRAYEAAAGYLRKAGRVMAQQKREKEWDQYLQRLREKHARKRRLMEILDSLEKRPILRKKR